MWKNNIFSLSLLFSIVAAICLFHLAHSSFPAIDSDFLVLYTAPSTIKLPDDNFVVGDGVFARVDILKDEIICEYRGPIVDMETADKIVNNKKMNTVSTTGELLVIIGENICTVINDAAMIVGQKYTRAQMEAFKSNQEMIPTYPGYEYNVEHRVTRTGKVIFVASKDISADAELFYSYGK